MSNRQIDLLNGPIDKTLRQFAAPLALSFLINILYSWVDLYFVSLIGDGSGNESTIAMAALGISERIWFFAFSIASGLAIGSSVIIARRIGEGDIKNASYTAVQALIIMLNFSLIIVVSLFLLLPFILSNLGMEAKVVDYAEVYFSGLALGMPFNFLVFQINSIFRGVGNSFLPMVILIASTLLNAVITPALMFGFWGFEGYGFYGSGLGTSIAQFLGFVLAVIYLFGKHSPIHLKFNAIRLNWKVFASVAKVGFPASLQLIIISINSMIIASIANLFGTAILTTYIFALRIDLFIMMSIFAVGAAVEIATGQNLGARKTDRIFAYHRSAIKQISVILGFMSILAYFFGGNFAYIFTDNELIVRELTSFFKFSAWYYIPFAIAIISIRVISGAGDYIRSFYITLFAMVLVQISMAYSLSQTMESPDGIWLGILISMIVFMFAGLIQVKSKRWMEVKV